MHSQQTASGTLIVIECIHYLAYGTIFTRAMFRPKIILMFFPVRKAAYERWGVVPRKEISIPARKTHVPL